MMKNLEHMEIFNRSVWLLSPLFISLAVIVILLHFDFIEHSNKPPDIVTAIIVGACILVAILTAGRTRLYFDNSNRACIIEFNYIYGRNKKIYPYNEILHIAISIDILDEGRGYSVELVQPSTAFGLNGTSHIKLRSFGLEHSDYKEAVELAQKICQHTGLAYLDNTINARSNS
jgi:hypothetical protein